MIPSLDLPPCRDGSSSPPCDRPSLDHPAMHPWIPQEPHSTSYCRSSLALYQTSFTRERGLARSNGWRKMEAVVDIAGLEKKEGGYKQRRDEQTSGGDDVVWRTWSNRPMSC